ncbi:MAG: ArgE/DapE family deacylase [Anaerolineales bacterium]|nr:ArgE/DapE family deacylase [Anaerolineales bacterium]
MTQSNTTGIPAEIAQAVLAEVERGADETISFLREMVNFKTENPNLVNVEPGAEAACQAFIADRLKGMGMAVDTWEVFPKRPDVVATLPGSGGGRSLILNGHIDVVPAGDPAQWPYDPWAGEIHDGKMWGRGTCDMKGGIAAMIAAVAAVQRAGLRLAGDVQVQTVVDEEVGGPGTRQTLERGYKADAVIVTEPTGGHIHPVEGGVEWLRVVVRGVAGHTAKRYLSVHAGGQGVAVNAIEKMLKLLAAVQELERTWGVHKVHPLMPKGITTINIGVVLGGTGGGAQGMPTIIGSPSTFPDYCSTLLSLKYLPSERTEDVRAEFEDYLQRVAQADPWLREHPPEIEWGISGVSFPPVNTAVEHPVIQSLSQAYGAVVGQPIYSGFVAVTDLAWFAGRGIPGCLYGPGDLAQAHTSAEFVPLDDLLNVTKVLALTLVDWCGVA